MDTEIALHVLIYIISLIHCVMESNLLLGHLIVYTTLDLLSLRFNGEYCLYTTRSADKYNLSSGNPRLLTSLILPSLYILC